jgi:hypothetical protein
MMAYLGGVQENSQVNIDTKYDTIYNVSRRYSGCQPITIPMHEPIKKVYVEMVKQIVESEAVDDENAE